MKIAWIALMLLGPGTLWGATCRPVNLEEFRSSLPKDRDRLVFFASWCSSCSRFITTDRISNTVFIAVADEQPRAEKVLGTYLKQRVTEASCFLDKDESIARAYGVRNLPLETSLRGLPKP